MLGIKRSVCKQSFGNSWSVVIYRHDAQVPNVKTKHRRWHFQPL